MISIMIKDGVPIFQGLASEARSSDRLSARLAAQFQKLPRGM